MAKFIKTIVDRINLLNRKGLSPFYSPDQICAEVHAESLNVWKKLVKEYEQTQIISVYLRPFQEAETVALTNGLGALVTSKGKYPTAVMIPTISRKVTQYNIDKWASALHDTIRVPDETYPICMVKYDAIHVAPTTIASVSVQFLDTPTKPVYAYTVSDDDYVYNDASSVDFEWPEILHDEIMNRVLGNLGLSQREPQLIQYSNIERQTEGR